MRVWTGTWRGRHEALLRSLNSLWGETKDGFSEKVTLSYP